VQTSHYLIMRMAYRVMIESSGIGPMDNVNPRDSLCKSAHG